MVRMQIDQKVYGLTWFVKKSYLSSWVFTAMQLVHIRMNFS